MTDQVTVGGIFEKSFMWLSGYVVMGVGGNLAGSLETRAGVCLWPVDLDDGAEADDFQISPGKSFHIRKFRHQVLAELLEKAAAPGGDFLRYS